MPDEKHGRVLVLRDTQGVAKGHAVLPPQLIPIVARFTGSRTCAQIAKEAEGDLGMEVPVDAVEDLVRQLDEALFLVGDTFERALEQVRDAFGRAPVREASHAGAAYPGDRVELAEYIDRRCVERAAPDAPAGRMVGLVSPHIDPWRGAVGYGHAYGSLAAALPADVDTFVVLGTSHAPMQEPFALCRKAYDTPFGPMPVDEAMVDALAGAADFDPYRDVLNHKREHSIEFQAVFLKHVLGDREARVVPILAGLGEEQSRRKDPRKTKAVAKFLDALRELVAKRGDRVVVVAGADLAHVGPRFGDAKPHDAEQRRALEKRDRASLDLALGRDARAFWEHVAEDLDQRRVCGLAPVFSLLDVLPEAKRGSLLHYEQTVDDEDGSIVSHAAVGFYR